MSRELDAEIAHKVMGWPEWEAWPMYSDVKTRPVPHYSTDIEAAWQVVEKLHGMGLFLVIDVDPCAYPQDDTYTCRVYEEDNYIGWGEALTAPMAICKAALAAVEAMQKEEGDKIE